MIQSYTHLVILLFSTHFEPHPYLCCSVMAVPNTMIYFTLYDQLKVMYGFVEGQENVWSPMMAGITARSKSDFMTVTIIVHIELFFCLGKRPLDLFQM